MDRPCPGGLPAVPEVTAVASPSPAAASDALAALRIDDRFAALGDPFHRPASLPPLLAPRLLGASDPSARLLGLDPAALSQPQVLEILAGNRPLPGGQVLAVTGGVSRHRPPGTPQAAGPTMLLGEVRGPGGQRWEIQLSRFAAGAQAPGADHPAGGAPGVILEPALRELLQAQSMQALGMPTTSALSLVTCGDAADGDPHRPLAALARFAPSFVSFAHFEHFYYCGRHDALERLADHVIDSFHPALREAADPAFELLREVTLRTARLVAGWQSIGFCHGSMDTDRMSILGLTAGYGVGAFIEGFDAHQVADPADRAGRYAWSAQPSMGEWACCALGQAMLPLLGSIEAAQAAVAPYRRAFTEALEGRLRDKLGLLQALPQDRALFDALFGLLHEARADFTRFFRALAHAGRPDGHGDGGCRALFEDASAFDAWLQAYRQRLAQEGRENDERVYAMLATNPATVPRAAHLQRALQSARSAEDASREIADLLKVLSRPFDEPAVADVPQPAAADPLWTLVRPS